MFFITKNHAKVVKKVLKSKKGKRFFTTAT